MDSSPAISSQNLPLQNGARLASHRSRQGWMPDRGARGSLRVRSRRPERARHLTTSVVGRTWVGLRAGGSGTNQVSVFVRRDRGLPVPRDVSWADTEGLRRDRRILSLALPWSAQRREATMPGVTSHVRTIE